VCLFFGLLAADAARGAGPGATAADTTGGRVVQWGFSEILLAIPVPPAVDGTDGNAEAITAGGVVSCAIQAGTHAVVCWGNFPPEYFDAPAAVDGTDGTATAIASGSAFSCAIQAFTGAVVCWPGREVLTPPSSVDGTAGAASAIAAGREHACAIQAGTGAVICWGDNRYGQATPPPSVDGTAGTAVAIAAGRMHSCAIQSGTRKVICWGYDADPPASLGAVTALAAGNDHSCAIQTTGNVACWGTSSSADYGQKNPPASVNGTAGTASAIAAGDTYSCAIQAGTGAVVCWGSITRPPTSVDGTAGKASAIAAGAQRVVVIQSPECSDGLDAEGDGAIDYPADPGCDSLADVRETSQTLPCDDGLDDDGDRLTDFPSDPGCESSIDPSERTSALVCDDGLDGDGDGLVDFPFDPGCESPRAPSEYSEDLVCDDGIDNDGDGVADYPRDPNCHFLADATEQAFTCDDGIDNDGDGLTDYWADPGCNSYEDQLETSDVACDNGIDDDGDGFIDSPDDRNCESARDLSELPDQCDDGIDNDHNGRVDYPADPSCTDFSDRSERVTPVVEVIGSFPSGNPVITVGGDGSVYAGSVFPYPGFQVGHVVQDAVRVDHGVVTPLESLPLPVELDLRGFTRGGDGAYYGFETVECPECSYTEFVKITNDGVRQVVPPPNVDFNHEPLDSTFTLYPFVDSDGSLYALRYGDDSYDRIVRIHDGAASLVEGSDKVSVLRKLIASGWRVFSNLAIGGDGAIYGVRTSAFDSGQIFRIDAAGGVTTLHVYAGTRSASPVAPLALGDDGAMYGVTQFDGPRGAGTVFRVDPSGAFETVHAFDWTDGARPEYPLVRARDGVLYGVTGYGFSAASFFRVEDGTITAFPILPFTYNSALIEGNDCALYGVAEYSLLYRVYEPGTLCQQIDFPPLIDQTLTGRPVPVSATSSAGLPVSFSATGSCTVDGEHVTLTGVGLCTVTASQPGDARYEAAPDVSRSFHVRFDFDGFLRPLMNPPVVNRVTAGRTVPIRFRLGADAGRDVIVSGSPSVRRVPCISAVPSNSIEGIAATNSGSLQHAQGTDRYSFAWKTDPSWAGTCQELALELTDGTVHRATFQFLRPPRRSAGGVAASAH
jgi:uncharacterized repeat protein (TIGR03803 family)